MTRPDIARALREGRARDRDARLARLNWTLWTGPRAVSVADTRAGARHAWAGRIAINPNNAA